jgi:hypothetical protein
MATRKKKTEPAEITVVKGSHLTVTYNNGYPEKLEWDWDALVHEVREACAGAELASMKPAVRAKVATRQKKAKA